MSRVMRFDTCIWDPAGALDFHTFHLRKRFEPSWKCLTSYGCSGAVRKYWDPLRHKITAEHCLATFKSRCQIGQAWPPGTSVCYNSTSAKRWIPAVVQSPGAQEALPSPNAAMQTFSEFHYAMRRP